MENNQIFSNISIGDSDDFGWYFRVMIYRDGESKGDITFLGMNGPATSKAWARPTSDEGYVFVEKKALQELANSLYDRGFRPQGQRVIEDSIAVICQKLIDVFSENETFIQRLKKFFKK